MRYVVRPRAAPDGDYDDPMLPSLSVDGEKRADTGLVDAKGHAIYRLQAPIGFGRTKER